MEGRAGAPEPTLDAVGARRAAILMISVDQDSAARILSQLDKAEQERIDEDNEASMATNPFAGMQFGQGQDQEQEDE